MLRKKGRLALALTAAADGDKGVTAVKQTAACQPKEKKDDEASGHRRGRERSPRPWRGRRPNWTAQPLEMRVVAVGNHARRNPATCTITGLPLRDRYATRAPRRPRARRSPRAPFSSPFLCRVHPLPGLVRRRAILHRHCALSLCSPTPPPPLWTDT